MANAGGFFFRADCLVSHTSLGTVQLRATSALAVDLFSHLLIMSLAHPENHQVFHNIFTSVETSLIRSALPASRAVRLFAHLFIKKGGVEKEGSRRTEKDGANSGTDAHNLLWWFSSEQKSFNLSVAVSAALLLFYLFMSCAIERLLADTPPACVQPTCSCHFNNI